MLYTGLAPCKMCGAPDSQPCTAECEDNSVPDNKVQRKWCYNCGTPLTAELDAYYGRDEYLAKLCTKCRGNRK